MTNQRLMFYETMHWSLASEKSVYKWECIAMQVWGNSLISVSIQIKALYGTTSTVYPTSYTYPNWITSSLLDKIVIGKNSFIMKNNKEVQLVKGPTSLFSNNTKHRIVLLVTRLNITIKYTHNVKLNSPKRTVSTKSLWWTHPSKTWRKWYLEIFWKTIP